MEEAYKLEARLLSTADQNTVSVLLTSINGAPITGHQIVDALMEYALALQDSLGNEPDEADFN